MSDKSLSPRDGNCFFDDDVPGLISLFVNIYQHVDRMADNEPPGINILLLGDSECGKSTFLS